MEDLPPKKTETETGQDRTVNHMDRRQSTVHVVVQEVMFLGEQSNSLSSSFALTVFGRTGERH